MTTGTVKWFNSTKGFSFIQPDNGGGDAFVHISAVERAGMREIVECQKIGFDLERDIKSGKMSACNHCLHGGRSHFSRASIHWKTVNLLSG